MNGLRPQHKLRIETVEIKADAVVLIDQLALPHDERYVTCTTWQEVAGRIRDMTVRGAPAIGVAAAGALALAGRAVAFGGVGDRTAFNAALDEAALGLAQTRPTAVNLTWAIGEMRALWQRCDAAPQECWLTLLARAREIHDDDIRRCYAIGAFGAPLFKARRHHPHALQRRRPGDRRLRHRPGRHPRLPRTLRRRRLGTRRRNAPLAAGRSPDGVGARRRGHRVQRDRRRHGRAFHLEGRGRRHRRRGRPHRRNGDTANKIGTYTLSVLAKEHGVPFYVAAPLSTVDRAVASGADIPIEERDPDEVTSFRGVQVAPAGAHARHPAFDITPQANISAIVTEVGVLRPPFDQALRRACLEGTCG